MSTLTYETSKNFFPHRLSVAYCIHILQTKLMLKNWSYPKTTMFTASAGPTDVPVIVLG
jgi:hypothetical protein